MPDNGEVFIFFQFGNCFLQLYRVRYPDFAAGRIKTFVLPRVPEPFLLSILSPRLPWWLQHLMKQTLLNRKSGTAWHWTIRPENCIGFLLPTDPETIHLKSVANYPQIRLLHLPERKGKVAAMNRAIRFVETPYAIFSDANTLLNPTLRARNRETLC